MEKAFILVIGLVVVAAIVAAIALSGGPPPPVPIRSVDPALLADRESPGAQVLVQRCGQCHGVPDPKAHVASEWPIVIRRMVAHANARMPGTLKPLDEDALRDVDAYLRAHASDVPNPQ